MPLDLFGEIPVTWDEVCTWCEVVAGIAATSSRFSYYVEHWNVPEKIRAAKRDGSLAAILAGADRPAPAPVSIATERRLGRVLSRPARP